MKKFLTILLITSMCLSFSGCGGNKSAKDTLGEIKTNMDSVQSIDMDIHIVSDITQKFEEIRIPQKIEYSLNIKENSDVAYITGEVLTTVNETNNKYEIEAYQTSGNMNYSLYFKQDDTWYRQDAEENKKYGMTLLKMLYESGMEFSGEEAEINGQQCNVLTANVYGELADEFTKLIGVSTTEEKKVGVIVYTYKENSYPAYMKIDLKDVVADSIKNKDISNTVNNMYVEITFNSFNQTDVALPDDIKKDAKKKQDEEQAIIQDQETETTIPTTEEPSSTEKPIEVITENPEETENPNTEISKLSTEWNSFQFDYNGNIYRVPMGYKVFEASGYSMKEEEKSMIMEKGQVYTTTLYNGEMSIIVKIENTTTAPRTLSECDIISIDLDTYSLNSDELAKFMFSNNVNFAASYDNIVEAWGEPTNIHDGTALKIVTYKDGNNYIEVYFDPGTNEIIEYKINAK